MKTFNTYIQMKEYIADAYYGKKKVPAKPENFYVRKDNRAYTYYPRKDLIVHSSSTIFH